MMATLQQEDKFNFGAKKFMMWIFIFTSFMLFAAWSSGFIVYSGGKGKGLNLALPQVFLYSTLCIVFSSVTMFLASKAATRLQFDKQRLFLWLTIAFGVLFFAGQFYGCSQLVQTKVFFVNNNASQSFIYVFVIAHLLHVVAGIIVLLSALTGSYKNIPQVKNLFKMQMASIFWHFIDIIWIYLYVFLLLNQR
jgi:cytochrome c oxidase subunit 3